jgi:hypothetical protein
MDGDGVFSFKQEVTKLLIRPLVDGVEYTKGHVLVLACKLIEFDSTP